MCFFNIFNLFLQWVLAYVRVPTVYAWKTKTKIHTALAYTILMKLMIPMCACHANLVLKTRTYARKMLLVLTNKMAPTVAYVTLASTWLMTAVKVSDTCYHWYFPKYLIHTIKILKIHFSLLYKYTLFPHFPPNLYNYRQKHFLLLQLLLVY